MRCGFAGAERLLLSSEYRIKVLNNYERELASQLFVNVVNQGKLYCRQKPLFLRDILVCGSDCVLNVGVLDRDLHTMTTRHQILESIKYIPFIRNIGTSRSWGCYHC